MKSKKIKKSKFKLHIAKILGAIFYDKNYLKGKYFLNDSYSDGWSWVVHCFFMQKIIGINKGIPFPVSFRMSAPHWYNMEFDLDNMNIFQKIGNYYQAANAKIVIGNGTWIANNVGIITTNHDLRDPSVHGEGKEIQIGECCWIGFNSVILPGVTLGPHTIVGAGSVVTHSFPDGYCVIGGNPARYIKPVNQAQFPEKDHE